MLQSVAAPAPTLAICNCADGWRLVKPLRDAGLPHLVSLIHERVVHYSSDVWHTIHQNSDRVILPAHAVKAAAAAVLPDFQDALVVPQGLLRPEFGRGDRNAARVAVRDKLGLSLDTAIILGCGTQDMRKGVDLFIQLAARVRARSRRDVHFVWLGAEQNYRLFSRLIELDISQLDLSSTVSLLGEVTDTEPYFLAADAFALTSRDDPFPCAVQEAMACALPIITFEGSGGAKEALSGGSGIVVPYMDIDAMATSLTTVIEAPSRYAGMAERARSRVRSVYRFSEYAERIKQVCDVVTGKRALDDAADAYRSTAQQRQDQERPNPFAAGKKWFQGFVGNVSRAIRAEQWWNHKLVPMFAVFYATAYVHQAPIATVWRAAVALLLAIAPCAAYVSIVNDVTDRADDRRAGKANRMAGRPVWQIVLLLAAPLCVAVFFTVLWRDDIPLAASYLGAWIAFSLYSIPPFRLKARGIFGVIADACGSHVFPTLTAALLALRAIESAIDPGWIWALALWAFGCGLRGILWHQLYDDAADRATAVRTFVVRHSRESAIRLARVALLFELVGLGLLFWRADSPWLLVPLLIYVVFISAKSRLWHLEIVIAEPRGQYAILGQEYYTFLFPLGFLLFCALHSPLDWAVLAGHVVVFPLPATSFINEARELLGSALRRVRLHAGSHGALPAAGAASAGAARRDDSPPTVSAAAPAPTLDVAIAKAAAFLRERLRSGSYALAAIGSDGTPRFPDDKGHLFVASFMAEAMDGLFDEVDRTIILTRILSEEQNEAWGYQSPGMLYDDDTRPFLVDSDDSAFVIRTLHRLGVNREPRGLMRFYRESERLFVTWDKGTHTPVSLSTEPSLQNNFLAHPEVNANIFFALRDTHFEQYVNYDVLLQAQDARGFWKSYFYPTPLYATLLVLDLTQGNAAFTAARERALSFIAQSQNADGSWGAGGDPYETALAVAALARQGAHAEATQRGVAFLLSTIAEDGSWTSTACIWESYWTEDDIWRGYDRHRAYITARCLTALRRAARGSA